MKRLELGVVLLLGLTVLASGATRTCLVDFFTNTSCGPCAPADPFVDSLADVYGHDLAVLEVHVWWPSSADPFFVYNVAANAGRAMHYQSFGAYVDAVPSFVLDGKELSYYTAAPTAIISRLAVDAPLALSITAGESIKVEVDVETPVTGGDQRIFVALTESELYFPSPIEIDSFQNVLREILPDNDGRPIDLTTTGVQEFVFMHPWDPDWDPAHMKAITWVQDMSASPAGYNVHNAAWAEVTEPTYYFSFDAGVTSGMASSDTMIVLGGGDLENLGGGDDSYEIRLIKDLPTGWSAAFCSGTSCFPDSGIVDILSGNSEVITVEVFTAGDGAGSVNLAIKSLASGRVDTASYVVVQNPTILLVDDDAGSDYEYYYETSLVNLGEISYTHCRDDGELSATDLSSVEIVVWMTGNDWSDVFTSDDTTAIGRFLDGGGKLFITGQDIGYFCNEMAWSGFYQNRFKAEFVADDTDILTVIGSPGGIFDGLIYDIIGGDGAGNAVYPSEINAYGGGVLAMQYNGGSMPGAAVVYEGAYSLVYFAFPFEAISTQADRDSTMARILDFLRSSPVVEDGVQKPEKPLIISAAPNPFNPATELSFEITEPENGRLEIFDINGRKVAVLAEEALETGRHTFIWNGRDDFGRELPSGVYMARLIVGEKKTTRKLLLAK
ncbi:hypothetical protein DRQ36_06730 [bacterium]|nr:MAG: hypothetical protein DRQ36_06730 [bacterium]